MEISNEDDFLMKLLSNINNSINYSVIPKLLFETKEQNGVRELINFQREFSLKFRFLV